MKISGDRKGENFKLTLQILNIEDPNSTKNTQMMLCVKCNDKHYNFKQVLGNHLYTKNGYVDISKQVRQIDSMEWQGKKVRFFNCRDYKFELKLYWIPSK